MTHETEYMTTEDVCELYHVTRRSVYRWRRNGLIKGLKVGRAVLYTPEEVALLGERLDARDRAIREAKRAEVMASMSVNCE